MRGPSFVVVTLAIATSVGCGIGVTGTAAPESSGPGPGSSGASMSGGPSAPRGDVGGGADAAADTGTDAPAACTTRCCTTESDCGEQEVCAGGFCRVCGEPGSDGLQCNGKDCKTCVASSADCHCD